MKRFSLAFIAALAGGIVGALLALKSAPPAEDASEAYTKRNKAVIDRLVLADLEKYGMDVYRLYLEVSQAMPGDPGSDFAAEKAMRKLAVTYPDSNILRLVEAQAVHNAIRGRDMLQIEQFLEKAEQQTDKSALLMPNGYEILPQLVAAQYNYYFHTGRLDEAEKTLDYLAAKHGGGFIFQPQEKGLPVADFVARQRQVLGAVRKQQEEGK